MHNLFIIHAQQLLWFANLYSRSSRTVRSNFWYRSASGQRWMKPRVTRRVRSLFDLNEFVSNMHPTMSLMASMRCVYRLVMQSSTLLAGPLRYCPPQYRHGSYRVVHPFAPTMPRTDPERRITLAKAESRYQLAAEVSHSVPCCCPGDAIIDQGKSLAFSVASRLGVSWLVGRRWPRIMGS